MANLKSLLDGMKILRIFLLQFKNSSHHNLATFFFGVLSQLGVPLVPIRDLVLFRLVLKDFFRIVDIWSKSYLTLKKTRNMSFRHPTSLTIIMCSLS